MRTSVMSSSLFAVQLIVMRLSLGWKSTVNGGGAVDDSGLDVVVDVVLVMEVVVELVAYDVVVGVGVVVVAVVDAVELDCDDVGVVGVVAGVSVV